jgi:hypothetical protein
MSKEPFKWQNIPQEIDPSKPFICHTHLALCVSLDLESIPISPSAQEDHFTHYQFEVDYL